jgi:hypothetical protein
VLAKPQCKGMTMNPTRELTAEPAVLFPGKDAVELRITFHGDVNDVLAAIAELLQHLKERGVKSPHEI